ncbi:hypothetical protein NK865_000216, partial [Salmonella enterica]|nr:hypothetical protein [Salmonella enterica]
IMIRTFPVPKNKEQRKEFEQQGIKVIWKKIYADDKALFKLYYNLFATKVDAIKSDTMHNSYKSFMASRNAELALKAASNA